MNTTDFKTKLEKLTVIATKNRWELLSVDSNCGRVSLKDDLSIYRVDIYTSKMTVCFLPAGDKPKYFKRQNLEMIDKLLSNPFSA